MDARNSFLVSSALSDPSRLSRGAGIIVVIAAFLGWFFGGMQILLNNFAMRDAALDLLTRVGQLDHVAYGELLKKSGDLTKAESAQLADWKSLFNKWYAWLQCAFLFGAAAGGFIFGKLGDKLGRTRALGISLIWFAAFTGLTAFVQTPALLVLFRFLACLGIGGTWPNGVSLVSEFWSKTSRPILASWIGMAGNVGIFFMAWLATQKEIHPEDWRWMLYVNSAPVILGVLVLLLVPESPVWKKQASEKPRSGPQESVFNRRFLPVTLIGIALATVPLIGGWGSANWMIPWAADVEVATEKSGIRTTLIMYRSIASIVGSFIAGFVAVALGRRQTYLLAAVGAFLSAQFAFWFTLPGESSFYLCVTILGLFNGLFFGWLPFFLPELFPTKIRATGAGVSFNFGRILTALTIFGTGWVSAMFSGDYAVIGRITSLIFLLGILAIKYAPDTAKEESNDPQPS